MSKRQKKDIQGFNTDALGLSYPCEIDVKVFLKCHDNNLELVRDVLLADLNSDAVIDVSSRLSSGGKYQSFSCKIVAATSQEMDNLYHKLTSHPEVVMVI